MGTTSGPNSKALLERLVAFQQTQADGENFGEWTDGTNTWYSRVRLVREPNSEQTNWIYEWYSPTLDVTQPNEPPGLIRKGIPPNTAVTEAEMQALIGDPSNPDTGTLLWHLARVVTTTYNTSQSLGTLGAPAPGSLLDTNLSMLAQLIAIKDELRNSENGRISFASDGRLWRHRLTGPADSQTETWVEVGTSGSNVSFAKPPGWPVESNSNTAYGSLASKRYLAVATSPTRYSPGDELIEIWKGNPPESQWINDTQDRVVPGVVPAADVQEIATSGGSRWAPLEGGLFRATVTNAGAGYTINDLVTITPLFDTNNGSITHRLWNVTRKALVVSNLANLADFSFYSPSGSGSGSTTVTVNPETSGAELVFPHFAAADGTGFVKGDFLSKVLVLTPFGAVGKWWNLTDGNEVSISTPTVAQAKQTVADALTTTTSAGTRVSILKLPVVGSSISLSIEATGGPVTAMAVELRLASPTSGNVFESANDYQLGGRVTETYVGGSFFPIAAGTLRNLTFNAVGRETLEVFVTKASGTSVIVSWAQSLD